MAPGSGAAGRTARRGTMGATGRLPVSESEDLKAQARRAQVRQGFVTVVFRERQEHRPKLSLRDPNIGSYAANGGEAGRLMRYFARLRDGLSG